MENKSIQKIIDINSNIIFKLDYYNQNLENNKEFNEWNQSMLKENGNNIKLFKCKKDNILFYLRYNEYIHKPSFCGKCPLCNNNICLFCSYNFKYIHDWDHCCIKRGINQALFYYGFQEPREYHLVKFIPGLNSFLLFGKIFEILYLDVVTKKSKNIYDVKYKTYRRKTWM